MLIVGTVGRRGQITLPRAVRQLLNLQEGDRIIFEQRGDEVILRPLYQTLTDLRGSVPVAGEQDFESIRRGAVAEHARKVAGGDD